MKKTVISVTEAARNFAECVNRVRYQNMTFVLVKNGTPVARLVPEGEKVRLGHDLAKILRKADLPAEEFKAWNRDLRAARKILKPPKNRWR
jgi:prevent-host-death family protein